MPVKVSVFALNLSQVGSACPFDNVAVYLERLTFRISEGRHRQLQIDRLAT